MGIRVGYRVLDLLYIRDKPGRKENKILGILTFITQNCWKFLWGKQGELLKGQDSDTDYMINDRSVLLNRFSTGDVNVASFAAGIVEGILCSAEFPAQVSAHIDDSNAAAIATTILIRFFPEVVARDKALNA
eukprot:GHVO01004073.1.p1 GENE.GHVO01004073.1~~GHVO01004073.1.p1  ORF type:complete len:132 (+),score=20.40 GHVO01004073.1:184-579(+)